MEQAVADALEPVWRDVQRTGGVEMQITDEPIGPETWRQDPRGPMVYIRAFDGTGTGIPVDMELSPRQRIAQVADGVQEAIIEARVSVGLPSNWPACPLHPNKHPLAPVASDLPTWICPVTGAAMSPIGDLPTAR